jgi:predicted DNA-binding WGR domain protein
MANIDDLQRYYSSANVEQRIAFLLDALRYGQEGLDIVIQALRDEAWQVQGEAFRLLRDRSKLPHVKQALQDYIAIDNQYPLGSEEINLYSWTTEETTAEGFCLPASELLELMTWGEIIQIDEHDFSGVHIVDCDENGKRWKSLTNLYDGPVIIPLKFLQKKGYSYYYHQYSLEAYLPLFNGKEIIEFNNQEIYDRGGESLYKEFAGEYPEDYEYFSLEEMVGQEYAQPFTQSDVGLLIKKNERWLLMTEDGGETNLLRLKKFYLIPRKYLSLRGYQYYRQVSVANNLPIIGYLSPKEYLDFFRFRILDWSLFSDVTVEEKAYLEFSDPKSGSHKFYEVTLKDTQVIIRYGRINRSGRTQTTSYPTIEDAKEEVTQKIHEKLQKGYKYAVGSTSQNRPITRRPLTSTASTAPQAPILWKFHTGSPAFALFVDDENCWVGNQAGQIFILDHQGHVSEQFQLPNGVRCLVADDIWTYAGCDDGKVYDLTGKIPRVAYRIDETVDIFSLDINDGLLAVSDAHGGVMTIDYNNELRWTRQSQGTEGWMILCDGVHVYHGHSEGVTVYDLGKGETIHNNIGNVLSGCQEASFLYVGIQDGYVQCLSKTGERCSCCYCDSAPVYSCTAAFEGRYVFAGDSCSSIYCFCGTEYKFAYGKVGSGKLGWKLGTGCGSVLSMQLWQNRLYIATTDGVLACIDVSKAAIQAAFAGRVPQSIIIEAPQEKGVAPGGSLETTSDTTQGVIVKCVREGKKLKVYPVSPEYNPIWDVQFAIDICQEDDRYLVEEVLESKIGNFYRAYGDIKKLV